MAPSYTTTKSTRAMSRASTSSRSNPIQNQHHELISPSELPILSLHRAKTHPQPNDTPFEEETPSIAHSRLYNGCRRRGLSVPITMHARFNSSNLQDSSKPGSPSPPPTTSAGLKDTFDSQYNASAPAPENCAGESHSGTDDDHIPEIPRVTRKSIEGECPICLIPLDEKVEIGGRKPSKRLAWCYAQCGHNFHYTCVKEWYLSLYPREDELVVYVDDDYDSELDEGDDNIDDEEDDDYDSELDEEEEEDDEPELRCPHCRVQWDWFSIVTC